MISVHDARERMLAGVGRLGSELVFLEALDGRILAEPIFASRDQPPFDAAVMDGYAVRAADTPADVRIVGESAAGHAFDRGIGPREAVRISTGAPLPAGSDAVLAQEDAKVRGAMLDAPALEGGKFVRLRGGDFRAGDLLLDNGRLFDAGAIAAFAGAGHASARVTRKPVVAIIANGDELVSPGASVRDDQIFDSASHAVATLARAWGAAAMPVAPVADDEDALRRAASEAFSRCDILVIVGGASVGPHDHVRPALRALGARFSVEGVNVRPGRPTWFAKMSDGGLVLGLPGNPASALVGARLFLAPIIEMKLTGAALKSNKTFHATLTAALPANGPREAYLRAMACEKEVSPCLDEDSSLMSVLAASNCLVERAPNAPALASGAAVRCIAWTI